MYEWMVEDVDNDDAAATTTAADDDGEDVISTYQMMRISDIFVRKMKVFTMLCAVQQA